jgi:tetratricopeptide (TPR) repeat protein
MKNLLQYSLLLLCAAVFAQDKDKNLDKGNKAFEKKEYADAEANYRIAHSKAPTKASASYNLGNSIYRQGMESEAKFAYANAIDIAKTKEDKHKAYHNLGNVFMKEKNYSGAVEAYKNALRNNPRDEETRYNYALAKKMLKDNPPPPPPPKQKDKDKNQNKKDSDKDNKSQAPKDNGSEKENRANGGKDKEKTEKPGEGKEGQSGNGNRDNTPATESPSEQRMKNLLEAVDNEEKKVQDRVNMQNGKAKPVKQEKDW